MQQGFSDFRSQEYDRPNDLWRCGGEAEGLPCPLGPSVLGICQSRCTPQRDGDRYFCGNSSELLGACDFGPLGDGACGQFPPQCRPEKKQGVYVCMRGACQAGPLPNGECSRTHTCSPRRTIPAWRRTLVITTTLLTAGLLMIMLALPQRQAFVSPGPISAGHQGITGCASCHPRSENGFFHALLSSHTASQNEACLQCHADFGENAGFAHGVAPHELPQQTRAKPTKAAAMPLVLRTARTQSPAREQQLDCASCHSEHHGLQFDITPVSNLQCQICHTDAFRSFEGGHPEFQNYPYVKRTSVYFDHVTHYGMHFDNYARTAPRGHSPLGAAAVGGDNLSQTCSSCHALDSSGTHMTVLPFERSCASCHETQIASALVDVIRLPEFESTLNDVSPEQLATFLSRSETGFMRMLLSTSAVDSARESLSVYSSHTAELDANDLAREKGKAAAQLYLGALGTLLNELAAGDLTGLASRLQSVRPEARMRLASMLHLGAAARQELRARMEVVPRPDSPERWDTTSAPRATKAVDSCLETDSRATMAHSGDSFRWIIRPSSGKQWTLSYRPQHADPFLSGWMDVGAEQSRATALQSHASGESITAGEQLFAELAAPVSSGRCMKCHTTDRQSQVLTIPWKRERQRGLTKFGHSPHLAPLQTLDCCDCHEFAWPSAGDDIELFRRAFVNKDGTLNTDSTSVCTSGFLPVAKSLCASCHHEASGADHCLTCHNYHVGH